MPLATWHTVGLVLAVTLVGVALFRLASLVAMPGRSLARDLRDSNAARGLLHVGEIFAILTIASSSVRNAAEGTSFARDLLWSIALGAAGVALSLAFGWIGIAVLMGARLPREIERGNVAAGLAAGSHFVATGIISSDAMAGSDWKSLGLSLVFFLIAQVTLHAFVTLFRAITAYDDTEQIQGGNLAAGISYAGATIAVAIVVARALEGHFVSWSISLKGYAGVLVSLVALYPMRQLFVQGLVLGGSPRLRGGLLDEAVGADRNQAIAAVEAITYLATAIAVGRLA
jgi:uncharacterized membrane protein YjfL (UPF0719 family)